MFSKKIRRGRTLEGDYLKRLFLSAYMQAYDALPGFDHLPLPIRAFAFWSVPSLATLLIRDAPFQYTAIFSGACVLSRR